MYVHKEKEFLSRKRNALMEIHYIDHIMDLNIDITSNQLVPTLNNQCATDTFDSCVDYIIKTRMNDHCQLPFIKDSIEEIPICDTSERMHSALNLFQTSHLECLDSCSQIEVKIEANPVDWLYILMNPKFPVKTVIPGYYLTIPRTVLVSRMTENYTTISFIAEFGGWVGLFLGVSLLGVFELMLVLFFSSDSDRFFKKILMTGLTCLKTACTLCLAYILFKCCEKMITGEIQSKVEFQDDLQNISLSLCSTENIYRVEYLGANLSYVGNIPGFWNNITKLMDKIDTLQIDFQNGNQVIIKDFTQSQYYFELTFNIPRYGTYIETCHTLSLKSRIKKLKVKAKKEMSIYVHMSGQLFRPGRHGSTFINSDTIVNRNR